jgi:hypothetical protein
VNGIFHQLSLLLFRVRLSDVDEMIQNRFEAAGSEDVVSKENGPWPQEFCLE